MRSKIDCGCTTGCDGWGRAMDFMGLNAGGAGATMGTRGWAVREMLSDL